MQVRRGRDALVGRELSRIPLVTAHLIGARMGVAEGEAEHGWSASGCDDAGTQIGVGGVGAFGASRRGGPGAGDSVVGERLDQRADRPGVRRNAGQCAPLADVVHGRRRGWIARQPADRSRPGQERGGAGFGTRGPVGSGDGSAELDAAAIANRTGCAQRRDHLQVTAQQGAQKGGFRWRRPRHCLHGRQDAGAVDWSGLRLRLRRQQAEAGDIVLLFGDESEVLTHPYLAHAWATRGTDLRVPAPGQTCKRALLGVLDHGTGELIVHVSAAKRSGDFIALLEKLDLRYGPKPGRKMLPVVLVLDNGPIHISKLTRAALAMRPWLIIEWLPKYAPELNDIERSWRDLKRHFLAHRTFCDAAQLDHAIHQAVDALNRERRPEVCAVISEAA